MNRGLRYLVHLFFRGLIILGPIGITGYALYFIFKTIDGLIPWLKLPTGLTFLIVIFLVIFIGFLGTRFFFGRWLVEAMDYLLEHTPGIRFLYTSVKEVLDSFMGDKKKFNRPVWVKIQTNPEMWRMGFVTQQSMKDLMDRKDLVAVYLPHSYAISGWVIMISPEETRPVRTMNAAEAMRFAVSGGITGSIQEEENLERRPRRLRRKK